MATALSIKPAIRLSKRWAGDATALLYNLTAGQCTIKALDAIQIAINPVPHANYKEINSVEAQGDGKYKLTLNVSGLVGPIASLPSYDQVSLVANNSEQSDAVMSLFNVFHHRLIGYRYLTWLQKRPVLSYKSKSSNSHTALRYIAGLQKNTSPITEFLQAQALSLRARPLSRVVIEALLQSYFKMPMTLQTHVPSRCHIPAYEQTRLSQAPHANQLGLDTILGDSLWMCAHRSTLTIGPLSYQEFLELLPGGKMLQQLRDMLRRLVPANSAVSAMLILKKEAIPCLQFKQKPFQLGLNSWLCADFYKNNAQDSQFMLS